MGHTSGPFPEAPTPGPAPGTGGYSGVKPGKATTDTTMSQSQEASTGAPRNRYVAIAGVALGLLLLVVLLASGGRADRFLLIGLQMAPLAGLAVLAYLSARNSGARVLTYIWLAVLGSVIVLNVFSNVVLVYLGDLNGGSVATMFKPGVGPALAWTSTLLVIVFLASAATLLKPVRVGISRLIPIDPDNFVHKIAICFIVLLTASSFIPLIVLEGRPPLLELVKSNNLQALGGAADIGIRPVDLVYQLIWTIPATLLAAGWLTVRTFPAVLARLGMVRPSLRQVFVATVLGVVFWAVSAFLLEPGINLLWRTLGWPTTDVGAFSQLLGTLMTPLGAALIGITAGIGEEMAVRGLLQPRVGLVLSNLLFTSLHAFQYGFDAMLSVFVVGFVLGIVRARSNTSTSAVMHAVYNFTTVMAQIALS